MPGVSTVSQFRAQPLESRRTFWLSLVNGGLYVFAETLIDPNLVLILFASRLTDSNLLLGAISALSSGGWFLPQLFVSGWLQTKPRKIEVYRRSSFIRIAAWLFLAAVLWFVRQPVLLLALFYLAYGTMQISSGLGGIPFLDVIAKMIPSGWRGRLFASRLVAAGLLSLLGSRVVGWVLRGPLPYPRNYALLTFLAALFGGAALLAFCMTHETPGATRPAASLVSQFRRGMQILRHNADYRNLLAGRALWFWGLIAVPFYTLLAKRVLEAPDAAAADYLAITTLTTLLVNLPVGWLVDHRGPRWVLRLGALGWATSALLALGIAWSANAGLLGGLPFPAYAVAYPLFVMRGILTPFDHLAGHTLLLQISPEDDRPLYLGFANTLLGVVLLLSSVGGGLVDLLGIQALFGVAAVVNVLAFFFLGRIKKA